MLKISIGIALIALAALFLVFLYLSAPSGKKRNELEAFRGKYFAHRGLHNLNRGIPENSITAFKAAVHFGFGIENDIRLTADGEVVVFHDETLERACGANVKVSDLTLEELREYKLFGTEEKIPTLEECLETVNGKVPLLIEFKEGDYPAFRIYRKANEILSAYNGQYLVQSFDPRIMREYKIHNPEICRGQLASFYKGKGLKVFLAGLLLANYMSRPHFVSYKHIHKNNFFLRFNKFLGAFLICWTLRSDDELDECWDKFDAYIFEGFLPEDE
ncbi:MAG: glycerophosphodiester phosphodiesterase [Clostridia bacterium]|nr:glycerophosphodiester phosphodiesterase [Clostridia bacterium]